MKSLRSFPKLISAVLLVCAASLAWSCSDDDTGDDTFIPTFTLPEQPVIKNNYASQNNTITVVASPRRVVDGGQDRRTGRLADDHVGQRQG